MKSLKRWCKMMMVQGVARRQRWASPFHCLGGLVLITLVCSIINRTGHPSNYKMNEASYEPKQNVIRDEKQTPSAAVLIKPLPKIVSEIPKQFIEETYLNLGTSNRKHIYSVTKSKDINDNKQEFGFVNKSYHHKEQEHSLLETFATKPVNFVKALKESPVGMQFSNFLKAGASLRNHTELHKSNYIPPNKSGKSEKVEENIKNTNNNDINTDHFNNVGKKDRFKNSGYQPQGGSLINSMLQNLGPALVSSVMAGSIANSNSPADSLMSMAKNIVPKVIGGVMSHAGDGGSVMQAVASGIKDIAFSDVKNNANINSNQVLMSTFLKGILPLEKEKDGKPSLMNTFQSLAGNVAPMLLSAAVSNNGKNSNIMESIVPALFDNLFSNNNNNNNNNNKEKNNKSVNKMKKYKNKSIEKSQKKKNNFNEESPSKKNSEEDLADDETNAKSHDSQKENSGNRPFNQISTLVAESIVDFLPTSLDLDAPPYSKGILSEAFNYFAGISNNSQLLEWLRKEVSDDDFSQGIPPRLQKALQLPTRSNHREEIRKFYRLITVNETNCNQIRIIGGRYRWKERKNNLKNKEKKQFACMDFEGRLGQENCIVLSFGIRDEWSFEDSVQNIDTGCKVWAFDPSMQTGNHNHSKKIQFFNIGLDASNRTFHIHDQVWSLFTYSAILGHLGLLGTPISYLKIDLPKWEWKILDEIIRNSPDSLQKVRQLSITIHLNELLINSSLYKSYNYLIDQLATFGFKLFSSVPNNHQSKIFQDPIVPGRNCSLEYKLVFLLL